MSREHFQIEPNYQFKRAFEIEILSSLDVNLQVYSKKDFSCLKAFLYSFRSKLYLPGRYYGMILMKGETGKIDSRK